MLALLGPCMYLKLSLLRHKDYYYITREFTRDNSYSYCWTSRGSIYLRKTEGQPVIRIQSETDLTKLMKNKIWLANLYGSLFSSTIINFPIQYVVHLFTFFELILHENVILAYKFYKTQYIQPSPYNTVMYTQTQIYINLNSARCFKKTPNRHHWSQLL